MIDVIEVVAIRLDIYQRIEEISLTTWKEGETADIYLFDACPDTGRWGLA
jgi:hypothetical protein